MKMLLTICALLVSLLGAGGLAESPALHTQIVYGQSELGRDLVCHRIGTDDAETSILMVFGIHGYEDAFPRDGEVLKRIAQSLIEHYAAQPPQDVCLYIIPSANPDGLLEGKTKDGFGRCNAKGIDVNRDFPISWKARTGARNKTGKAPFSTAEARAIRDLVEQVLPTYAMDIHGWIEASYGTGQMAQVFADAFDFGVKVPSSGGMLCLWLETMTEEAIMIELPPRPNLEGYVQENSARMIAGIDAWVAAKAVSDK